MSAQTAESGPKDRRRVFMALSLHRSRRRLAVAAFTLAGTALVATGPAAALGHAYTPHHATVDPALKHATGQVHVVVQGSPATEAHVKALGGRVTEQLPIIKGYAATVPAAAIPRIAALSGVTAVTDDGKIHVQMIPGAAADDPTATDSPSPDATPTDATTPDPDS